MSKGVCFRDSAALTLLNNRVVMMHLHVCEEQKRDKDPVDEQPFSARFLSKSVLAFRPPVRPAYPAAAPTREHLLTGARRSESLPPFSLLHHRSLPSAQLNDRSVAITVGVLVLRSVIGQRRVRHADDRKGRATLALRNGLGHRALSAPACRARTRPAITPRPAHRGVADGIMVAIV